MSNIDLISNLGHQKYLAASKHPWIYLLKAILAGFYLTFAIIISLSAGAVIYQVYPQFSILVYGVTFPIGLILIIFLRAELFTGNNFMMIVSFLNKQVNLRQVFYVFALCWLGNLIGCFIIAFLYKLSYPQPANFIEFINATAPLKLHIPILQLIMRGILCNFTVCIAILAASVLQSEISKILIIIACVFGFIVSGFEHSVANMGTFSLALFFVNDFNIILALRNILFSTIGNMLGGGVLLAIPFFITSYKK